MKKQLFGLVLATCVTSLLCWGCMGDEGGEEDAGGGRGGGEGGGSEQTLAEAILGDWELFYSESDFHSGATGEGLTYFMFVDEENLCVATCSPFPPAPTADCVSDDYQCDCSKYTIEGDVITPEKTGIPLATTFEEGGQVFVGTAELRGTEALNKYRKTATLPASAGACKGQAER